MACPRSPGLLHYLDKVVGSRTQSQILVPPSGSSFRILLTGSKRRGNVIHGARPRAVAPSSRRMSSPARIPDWEREEGKLHPWRPASCGRPVIPADVVSCSHPRLGARGGETSSMAPGLVPSPRHPGEHDDILLSPSNPHAHCGEDSITRQTSSLTTHSMTGPSPSASMAANPANALSVSVPRMQFCVYFTYVYLPLRVYTTYLSFVRVFGPRANGGQQNYYTHVYSSSGPYGGRILPLVFICL